MNPQAYLRVRRERRAQTRQWEIAAETTAGGAWDEPSVNELADAKIPSGAWTEYQNLPGAVALSTHRVIVLHGAGLTPVLCRQWLARQDPVFASVTLLAGEVEAMSRGGIPTGMAGLYALAGFLASEALLVHGRQPVPAETLRVQAQLAIG